MGGAVLSAAMIAWAQSQIEGIPADKYKQVAEGLTWRWNGEPLSLAGRPGALLLTEAMAKTPPVSGRPAPSPAGPNLFVASPEYGSSFVVTDGARAYSGLPVAPGGVDAPLLVFHDGVPPVATDLKILQAEPALLSLQHRPDPGALVSFTPGTEIATPDGAKKIEDIGPSDRVMTRDNGAQEVQWIGHRRMSGARLFALPTERPIRIRQGGLRGAGPYEDLVVSPDQRILRRHRQARALWGEAEVLVRAGDLVGEPGVSIDHHLTETYYINLMLPNHEVIWANGMEVESFHPGVAGLSAPGSGCGCASDAGGQIGSLRSGPAPRSGGSGRIRIATGPTTRRALSPAEAEILLTTRCL